jgi:tetratricopeptide (TPR) repeat protein
MNTNIELKDAEKVDQALQSVAQGDLRTAESLLQQVVANTPSEYRNMEEDNDGVSIKLWDQPSFIHYVMWQKDHGEADRNITWIGNAYPRAHYYMGFLCLEQKRFDEAIDFLDRGQSLEPDNPRFVFEKAQVLVHFGRKDEALSLYESVTETGPYVSNHDLSLAHRGRGFLLIEMGDLDGAESAFKASLELDPGNEIANNELEYIGYLRSGGAAAHMETAVTSNAANIEECGVCGKKIEKEGIVVSVDGIPVSICRRCEGKITKKWWQFWK